MFWGHCQPPLPSWPPGSNHKIGVSITPAELSHLRQIGRATKPGLHRRWFGFIPLFKHEPSLLCGAAQGEKPCCPLSAAACLRTGAAMLRAYPHLACRHCCLHFRGELACQNPIPKLLRVRLMKFEQFPFVLALMWLMTVPSCGTSSQPKSAL